MTFNFYLPTFSNTLSNRFSIPFSISFKYYFFIISLFFLQNKIYTLTQSKYSIYIYIWNFILLYFLPITPQSCVVECVIFLFNSSFCPELVTNLLYLSWAVCRPSYVAHDSCTCIKYEIKAFIWSNGHISNYEIFYQMFWDYIFMENANECP